MTSALETAPAGSPLADLREQLKARKSAATVDLELPGELQGHLAIRLRALDWARAEKIRQRYEQSDDDRARVELFIDHLVNACETFLVRDGEKWAPLGGEGQAVRFTAQLAEGLGIPAGADAEGTADTHVICRGVFAAAAGGLAAAPDGVTEDEHWQHALGHADHLLDSFHSMYAVWLKGAVDVGAEEAMGE